MSKNILQDIKPLTSNGYRRITERESRPLRRLEKEEYIPVDDDEDNDIDTPTRKGKSRLALWISIILLVCGALFALTYLFGGTTITLNPKASAVSLDDTFTAVKNSSDKDLGFEVIALSGEETKTYSETIKKEANTKATGKVIIYNEFSSAPQQLKIDTRLETKDGKIYKTDKAVTVPGTTKKGTTTVPGQVEVGIYADVEGEAYNVKSADFTIFGFKGTPKYSKFYARTKTEITGGLKGTVYTIPEEEKIKAEEVIRTALQEKLLKQAESQVPEGYMYYKDAVFFDMDETSLDLTSTTPTVNVVAKGTMSIVLLNEEKLTQKIAEVAVSQYTGGDVKMAEIKNLEFLIKNKATVNPAEAKSMSFTLKGEGVIVWGIDTVELKNEILGKSNNKTEFKTLLGKYQGIDTAEVINRPVWRKKFPTNPNDIKIILNEVKPQ